MCTLDGAIGDLKTKALSTRRKKAGQVRSSKTPVDPKKALGLTCVRSRSKINKSREKFLLRLTLFTLFTANG